FDVGEICEEGDNLPLDFDPKCAWAMRNMHLFPVEINTAPLETLLRVPGIGAKSAYRIIQARRFGALDFDNLAKMRIILKRAKHFITCKGKFYGLESGNAVKAALLLDGIRENEQQISMFSSPSVALSALTGEI
ncbi:MAG: helix-hairpin-helix domain-containing protein, partial [Clostridia bacterium]|nr:helix-hairpin-helix domain-containing protein [Clostridia bacterium]